MMVGRKSKLDGEDRDEYCKDGETHAGASMAEKDDLIYEAVKKNLKTTWGQSNWKDVAKALAKSGLVSDKGKPYSEGYIKKVFYLRNKALSQSGVTQSTLPRHQADPLTGKLTHEAAAEETKELLAQIEAVLKLQVDERTKLALIKKIL